ncbi:MAG TPA: DUF6282 family protein [Candidatus Bathyarchaeia archaeon]|nr:DUF6282 family protein [Candidatus Bathyarchaeia archaeon]
MAGVHQVLSEEDREILRDAVDLHVHSGPECIPTKVDALDLAKQAMDFEMKAVVIKSHFTQTSSWAVMASKFFGKRVYGSVTLNWDVGGISPFPVRAALGPTYAGQPLLKTVWMPTLHSAHMIDMMKRQGAKEDIPRTWGGGARGGIPFEKIRGIVLDEYATEMAAILDIIAENKLVLATGHISPSEVVQLLDSARSHGVRNMILTHPTSPTTVGMSDEQILECAGKGAYVEFCATTLVEHPEVFRQEIGRITRLIHAIGPEHCILTSDLGRPHQPIPALGLLKLSKEILSVGISKMDLFKMIKTNPSHLLNLD